MFNKSVNHSARYVMAMCALVAVVGWISALFMAGQLTYYGTSGTPPPPGEWAALTIFLLGAIYMTWKLVEFRRIR